MKPKCILVLKKFQVLCQKSLVESRYPEHILPIFTRVSSPVPSMFYRGCPLPTLEAGKEFLAERNLLRFHYTWLNGINSTEIEVL